MERLARTQEPEVSVRGDESLLQGTPGLGTGDPLLGLSGHEERERKVGLGQGGRQGSQPAGLGGELGPLSGVALAGGITCCRLCPPLLAPGQCSGNQRDHRHHRHQHQPTLDPTDVAALGLGLGLPLCHRGGEEAGLDGAEVVVVRLRPALGHLESAAPVELAHVAPALVPG